MTDEQKGLTVGLGDGFVELSWEEGRDLAHLYQTPGWQVLKVVLQGLVDGTTIALRDREKTLEDLRFCQGQADAAGRIADIVEKEVPEWYNEGAASSEEGEEGSGEDDA